MKDSEINERLKKLEEKYAAAGQDMVSYLEGLLYAKYITYKDYIQLDTLLTLQKPRTSFPDEEIFITYHQITELYFKLILSEMYQVSHDAELSVEVFLKRLGRINRYFVHLTHSFEIMTEGMDPEQFLKFRMALLPASGFQSPQYRLIEFRATDLINLVSADVREELRSEEQLDKLLENLYWERGASELQTGRKTLTLTQFKQDYAEVFRKEAVEYRAKNLWKIFSERFKNQNSNERLVEELRNFDLLVNVKWPLVHLKSASRYLQRDPEIIAATGGTNWQKYLPPKIRRRMFYPELWTEEEKESWGTIRS